MFGNSATIVGLLGVSYHTRNMVKFLANFGAFYLIVAAINIRRSTCTVRLDIAAVTSKLLELYGLLVLEHNYMLKRLIKTGI